MVVAGGRVPLAAVGRSPATRALGERWQRLLRREIPWKMVVQRTRVFEEGDAEQASIFSDARFVEQKLREQLPADLRDLPLRVDIARHIERPHTRGPSGGQNFLFDSARGKVRPLDTNELYARLPTSLRICRIYAATDQHASTGRTGPWRHWMTKVSVGRHRSTIRPNHVRTWLMTIMASTTATKIPLIARYASPAMAQLWGDQRKFSTWRRLWVALAEAEQDAGTGYPRRADRGDAARGGPDRF